MTSAQTMGTFNLSQYDFVGFDMDNTLCSYNLRNFFTNHFHYLIKYLKALGNYDDIETELSPKMIDFMSRGLIVDVHRGNLLKPTSDGVIVRASHGTRILSEDDIKNIYGSSKKWTLLDEAIANKFADWRTKSEEMYSFMDFTDASVTSVYALAIDTGRTAKDVYHDVINGVITMYADETWLNGILENSECYMNKTSEKVLNWLHELRKHCKVALITSNYPQFVPSIARNSLGPNWKSLFDFTVYEAKKPAFFLKSSPFVDLLGKEIPFSLSGSYRKGSMQLIKEELSKHLNREAKCLYVGDSPYHDFMFTNIDFISIVEELKAEGLSPGVHPSSEFISSSIWGSYLYEGAKPTLFGEIAMRGKYCVCDLDFFAEKPIDYNFTSLLRTQNTK